MTYIQLIYGDRLFLVSTVTFASILMYHRYDNYYLDFHGWEVNLNDDAELIKKERFNLAMAKNEFIDLEVKVIDESIASRLIHNELPHAKAIPFTDKDYLEVEKKYHVLQKLLKARGMI